jgi:hypothetical protein
MITDARQAGSWRPTEGSRLGARLNEFVESKRRLWGRPGSQQRRSIRYVSAVFATVAEQHRDVLAGTERLTLRHVGLMSTLESAEGGLASCPRSCPKCRPPACSSTPTRSAASRHTNPARPGRAAHARDPHRLYRRRRCASSRRRCPNECRRLSGLGLRFDMRRASLLSKSKGSMTPMLHGGLPQGTLDLLILKTLALEPRHGWAISERLTQISGAALTIRQGSLYPALHRLERRGWIKAFLGCLGKQPARKVLRADQARPFASRGRDRRLAHAEQRHRASPGKRVAGGSDVHRSEVPASVAHAT